MLQKDTEIDKDEEILSYKFVRYPLYFFFYNAPFRMCIFTIFNDELQGK